MISDAPACVHSVSCVKESSNALGLGFRCGFLGLLHMDVFRQRLEQEFNTDIIITRCPCLASCAHTLTTRSKPVTIPPLPLLTHARLPSSPTVPYKARLVSEPDNEVLVSNPSLFPDPSEVISFSEPVILATIITPNDYLGPIMELCKSKRGEQVGAERRERGEGEGEGEGEGRERARARKPSTPLPKP